MVTIKKVASLTGIAAATLRAWEDRYGIGVAGRSDNGYRVYDDQTVAQILQMKRLVESGWSHGEAAKKLLSEYSQASETTPAVVERSATLIDGHLTENFLTASRSLDESRITQILDEVFSTLSFEAAVDDWLFPTLRRIGEEWRADNFDIAAEHFASNAIMRRLSGMFEGSGAGNLSERVIIGTPAGSYHEIGALAIATALRRRGIGVTYLGVNVPAQVWLDTLRGRKAEAALIAVASDDDVAEAREIVKLLHGHDASVLVAVGGAFARHVEGASLVLEAGIAASTEAFAQRMRLQQSKPRRA